MILLITPSDHAAECRQALANALEEEIVRCRSLAEAHRSGRTRRASCILLDQSLADAAGDELERFLGEAPAAPIVLVNLAISAPQRVLAQVRAARQRAAREHEALRRAVTGELRGELNSTLTGILLSSQLALAVPALPAAAEEKLRSVYRLARDMRHLLHG